MANWGLIANATAGAPRDALVDLLAEAAAQEQKKYARAGTDLTRSLDTRRVAATELGETTKARELDMKAADTARADSDWQAAYDQSPAYLQLGLRLKRAGLSPSIDAKDLEMSPEHQAALARADALAKELRAADSQAARDLVLHKYRMQEQQARPSAESLVQAVDPTTGKSIWVPKSDAAGMESGKARQISVVERTAAGFFNRMLEAEKNARAVEDNQKDRDLVMQGGIPLVPNALTNWLQTPAGQQYQQAQRTYTEARLRKESGAAIPQSEFDTDRNTNFRIAGDSPEVLAQKRKSRLQTMRGIANSAGRALEEYYGEGTKIDDLLKQFETGGAAAVPADVADALKGQKPGRYTLSDNSVWVVKSDGSISKGGSE